MAILVAFWWQFGKEGKKSGNLGAKILRNSGKSGKNLRDSTPIRGKIRKIQEETLDSSGISFKNAKFIYDDVTMCIAGLSLEKGNAITLNIEPKAP